MSTTEIQTQLPAGTWQVDATHSQVGFAVEYLVGTFRGSFSPVEATLAVAEDGTVELTGSADAEGIKVQDENLTVHLLCPDFFDAEQAPKITFAASDITLSGRNVEATGELTIKNITKPVELTGTFAAAIVDGYGNERIGLDARDGCRPHGVRPELEPGAADRRAGTWQRRHDHR